MKWRIFVCAACVVVALVVVRFLDKGARHYDLPFVCTAYPQVVNAAPAGTQYSVQQGQGGVSGYPHHKGE